MLSQIVLFTVYQLWAVPVWAAPSESPRIADWTEVAGLSESEAVRLTDEAIKQELTVDEDGEVCPVEDIWGYERDRGPAVAVEAYAKAPDVRCERTLTYDCRVVFSNRGGPWAAAYADCEPTFPERND